MGKWEGRIGSYYITCCGNLRLMVKVKAVIGHFLEVVQQKFSMRGYMASRGTSDWQATGNNVPKGKQELVIGGYRLRVAVIGRLLKLSYVSHGAVKLRFVAED